MGTVGLIDLPPVRTSPACIVQTDIPVKRHPVGHRCPVVLIDQRGIALLIGNAVDPRRSIVSPCRTAGYKIRLQKQIPVFVKKEMEELWQGWRFIDPQGRLQ